MLKGCQVGFWRAVRHSQSLWIQVFGKLLSFAAQLFNGRNRYFFAQHIDFQNRRVGIVVHRTKREA